MFDKNLCRSSERNLDDMSFIGLVPEIGENGQNGYPCIILSRACVFVQVSKKKSGFKFEIEMLLILYV